MKYRSRLTKNIYITLNNILPTVLFELIIEYILRIKTVKNHILQPIKALWTDYYDDIICVDKEIHIFSATTRFVHNEGIYKRVIDVNMMQEKSSKFFCAIRNFEKGFIKHKSGIFMRERSIRNSVRIRDITYNDRFW